MIQDLKFKIKVIFKDYSIIKINYHYQNDYI